MPENVRADVRRFSESAARTGQKYDVDQPRPGTTFVTVTQSTTHVSGQLIDLNYLDCFQVTALALTLPSLSTSRAHTRLSTSTLDATLTLPIPENNKWAHTLLRQTQKSPAGRAGLVVVVVVSPAQASGGPWCLSHRQRMTSPRRQPVASQQLHSVTSRR